jgi:small nuclear ribonucleoprotein (snRNP)-like protein
MRKSKGNRILDIFDMSKIEKCLKTFEKFDFVTIMKNYGLMKKYFFLFCYDIFLNYFFENNLGIFSVSILYLQMTYAKMPKMPKEYYCEKCHFICCKKSNYNIHLLTAKHLNTYNYLQNDLQKNAENAENNYYTCDCGKKYKHRQSMYTHKKKCDFKKEIEKIYVPELDEKNTLTSLILEVVKSNNELQKQVIELSKEKTNTFINNTNSHNKTFNLNVFLNDTCKDAMNIMDFVETVKVKLCDLENVGQLGYVDGITNIILKNLKELDIDKRPLHCSDLKRAVLYVKDNNQWMKENEDKEKIKMAIKYIAHKNIQMIPEWKQENPEYKCDEGKINDKYLKIIMQSMGGSDHNEDELFQEKIISKLAKEVTIEK